MRRLPALAALATALLSPPGAAAQTVSTLSYEWTQGFVETEPDNYGCDRPGGAGWAGVTTTDGFRVGAGEDGFGLTCASDESGTWAIRPLDLGEPLVFHNETYPTMLFTPLSFTVWVNNPACLSIRGVLGGEIIPTGCSQMLSPGANQLSSLQNVQDSYFWFWLSPYVLAARGGATTFGENDPFSWALLDITVEYTLPETGGPGDVVPEPATLTLLATGMAMMAARRRRR